MDTAPRRRLMAADDTRRAVPQQTGSGDRRTADWRCGSRWTTLDLALAFRVTVKSIFTSRDNTARAQFIGIVSIRIDKSGTGG